MWTVKQSGSKAEIISTLQIAEDGVPFHAAEKFAVCYHQQFPDFLIAKNVPIGSEKNVIYGSLWARTIHQPTNNHIHYKRIVILHFTI